MTEPHADIVAHLDNLATLARDAQWLKDSGTSSDGMPDDLSFAVDPDENPKFRQVENHSGRPPGPTGPVVFSTWEWLAKEGSRADLMRDFYAVFGQVAETSSFVHGILMPDRVRMAIVTGSPGSHGHIVQVDLVGAAVERLLSKSPKAGA